MGMGEKPLLGHTWWGRRDQFQGYFIEEIAGGAGGAGMVVDESAEGEGAPIGGGGVAR
jgi:hypothetical protein